MMTSLTSEVITYAMQHSKAVPSLAAVSVCSGPYTQPSASEPARASEYTTEIVVSVHTIEKP